MQDSIQREISIRATKQRVYEHIADAKKVVLWFPEAVEGDYAKGGQPVLSFGEYGKSRIYIVDAKPYDYFAYRWVPGSSHLTTDVLKEKTTLVEFRIRETGSGDCVVTMTESGFSALPKEVVEESFKQNTEGWDLMLGRLEKLLAQQ